ncbi:hypothetical protein RQP46_002538 [Phenoliferia psychrophenolica]
MTHAAFSTLPLELKARIVEMASDQEGTWLERVEDPQERAVHINGLSSLALVNKELRELAAKHQFRAVASRQTSPSIFRFRILPRYGHHITEVIFQSGQSAEVSAYALSILGQLPALRALRFTIEAAKRLFGSGVTLSDDVEDEDQFNRASVLELIAFRIEVLILNEFKPSEATGLVRTFSSNLRTLAFIDLKRGASSDLFSAMATVRHLTHLSIHVVDFDVGDWPPEARAPLERNPPPIKTLQLLGFPFDCYTLQLVGLLASTTETLTLLLMESTLADAAEFTIPPFTRLTRLNLSIFEGDLENVTRILSHTSTLLHISLLCYGGVNPKNPALLSFLDNQPALRHLHLEEAKGSFPFNSITEEQSPPSSLMAYTDLVHSRGLDPSVLDRPHLTPFHPDADLDYTREEQPFLSQSLRRTLEFGLGELDRMFAEGSVGRAVGWVAKLKALEDERLVWKD